MNIFLRNVSIVPGDSGGWSTARCSCIMYLELVLTITVGTVLTGVLLMCYVYVFRQLCCPPPRRRTKRANGAPPHVAYHDANGLPITEDYGRTRESLPLNNVTAISSQPTETDRI